MGARRRGGGGGRRRGRGRGRGGQSVGQFLRPRTGRQASRVANAQASAEYNPEIRQLRQDAKGSRKRQQNLGAWYAQLAQDYQGAQSSGAAALQSIQDTTSKQLAEAGERSSADLSKLSSEDEDFAKLVGGPKDTSGLSQIAAANAAAQRSRVALGQPVAQEQANFVGRLGSDKTAARMQGIESRREEARRRDKIRSDLAATRREKGASRVARKEDIRLADRDYATQLKQLRLARREAASAEQQAAADAAIAQVEAAREARQDALANRQAQERIGISARNAGTSARNAGTSERSQRATARNYRADNRRQAREARAKRRGAGQEAATVAKNMLRIKRPKNARQWALFEAGLQERLGKGSARTAAKTTARLRRASNKPPPVPYANTPKGRRAARRARGRGRRKR